MDKDSFKIEFTVRNMDLEFELEQMADENGRILVVECEDGS